ncbi:unnamed protein product [Effrenium voratum]|nr:unnamed protein product [Effrenium voratum]
MPHPGLKPQARCSAQRLLMAKTMSIRVELDECVEVWRAGEWAVLPTTEWSEIIRRKKDTETKFDIISLGVDYHVDLETMTRTELKSGRSRAIRFAQIERPEHSTAKGFEAFREVFHEIAVEGEGHEELVTEDCLLQSWPGVVDDEDLLVATVSQMYRCMLLREKQGVNLQEWVHYWALHRGDPPKSVFQEVNERLRQLVLHDAQVLQRLQLQFESAARTLDIGLSRLALSLQELLEVCRSMVEAPERRIEQTLAGNVLQAHQNGKLAVEEDEHLHYHDFLNVMLGRHRQRVYMWMYDITAGKANAWSWLLGTHFTAFWHTGVVVEFADGPGEFWFGGKIFVSPPGTTPFGEPLEKRFMGYTYKSRDEVVYFIGANLAFKFHRGSYDSLTHNCNHFSDKLLMHLTNEHVPGGYGACKKVVCCTQCCNCLKQIRACQPDEILRQPEKIANLAAVQLVRPLLNRWLGTFQAGSEPAPAEAPADLLAGLGPSAVVRFARREGGLQQIGRVDSVCGDYCVVKSLDFWRRCLVERHLHTSRLTRVLAPGRGLCNHHINPKEEGGAAVIEGRAGCWLPSLLTAFEPAAKQ